MRQPLHITAHDAAIFEAAAKHEGFSLQEFVLHAAVERANRILAIGNSRELEMENLLAQAHSFLGEYGGQAYHEVQALRARIREVLK